MSVIRRFLRLPDAERALLPRLVVLVTAVRLGLWLMPLARLQRLLNRPATTWLLPSALAASLPVGRVAWAVSVASRPVPAATCLAQALALQHVLARGGRSSDLRIGVALSADKGFQAHAWVDCDGHVLIDRPEDVAVYTPLASWASNAGALPERSRVQ